LPVTALTDIDLAPGLDALLFGGLAVSFAKSFFLRCLSAKSEGLQVVVSGLSSIKFFGKPVREVNNSCVVIFGFLLASIKYL
jgi:hypothetical protein